MNSPDQHSQRHRLTNFDSDDANKLWQVVNDNVMGGQSNGGLSFGDGILSFTGTINTDGGGFSSLRLPFEAETLSPYGRIKLRARPDGRDYLLTLDDGPSSRNRQVSHRAPMPFTTPGEWQIISISFGALSPAIFGRPIADLPFQKDLVNRLGLMISDGVDGPFRLDVDWIDLCS